MSESEHPESQPHSEIELSGEEILTKVAMVKALQDEAERITPRGQYDQLSSREHAILIKEQEAQRKEYYEASDSLNDELLPLLEAAEQKLSPQEKIQFIKDVIPIGRWDRTNEIRLKERTIPEETGNRAALLNLVNSIPAKAFSEADIEVFLAKNQEPLGRKGGYSIPTPVRQRAVEVLTESDPEISTEYFGDLKADEIAEVVSTWGYEKSLSVVEELVERGSPQDLITATSGWTIDQQKPIFTAKIRQGYKVYGHAADPIFSAMSEWPPEDSRQIVESVLKDEREVVQRESFRTYQDLHKYYRVADAVCDWPPEEIEALLANSENTKWTETIPSNIAQRRDDAGILEFKLRTYRSRTEPFTAGMIEDIKTSMDSNHQTATRDGLSVIKNHHELFDEDIALAMLGSPLLEPAEYAASQVLSLDIDQQYRYLVPIAEGLARNWRLDARRARSSDEQEVKQKDLYDMVSSWDAEHRTELIITLLSSEAPRHTDHDTHREAAYKLLAHEDSISDPIIVKTILTHDLADYSRPRTRESLLSKIEENAVTQEIAFEAATDAIGLNLLQPNRAKLQRVLSIADQYQLGELAEYFGKLPRYVQSVVDTFGIRSAEELADFFDHENDLVKFLSQNPDEPCQITPEEIRFLNDLPINLLEAEQAKHGGVELAGIGNDESYQRLFESLIKINSNWRHEQAVAEPFRGGAEIFGYRRMFEYANRQGLTRHDALHAFNDIVELYEASDLTQEEFYGQIMTQVSKDNSLYDSGTAHHEFNSIAQTLSTNFGKAREIAAQYPHDKELQELAELLSDPQEIFASWNRLKFASSRMELLGRTELLDQLQALKGTSEKQYNYFRTLLMHPASKVDAEAVLELWRDPESFLERLASHTPDGVQDRKKPSNYIHIPNLDLTAEELRDAMIEGDLDRLQAFSPLEIKYQIPVAEGRPITSLAELTSLALGSRKQNIQGKARNPGKVFSEVNGILKTEGVAITDFLQGSQSISPETANAIRDTVLNEQYGLETQWQEISTQIHPKSDPNGVLASNDTAECMPFGDGKNNVYTWNLNTAQYTLQVNRGDGSRRTIVQSVMTKDKDIGVLVTDLLTGLEESANLADTLSQDVLRNSQAYIAAHSAGVAPNWRDGNDEMIAAVYLDFFSEYVERYGEAQGFNPEKMVIGIDYTHTLTQLPKQPNTFIPQAPVSYSDKLGPEVYVLDLKQTETPAYYRQVNASERTSPEILGEEPQGRGVSFLTYEDSLSVGYMEGKAYADNPDMMQYLHNMENALIGMQINNTKKGRPHMSLKYSDADGQMRGYMLAYEGRFEDEYEDDWKKNGERVVYIADLASDKEHQMTGGRLINSFVDLYQRNYLNNDDLVPLYMEAREKTSYPIILKQLNKIGKRLGVEFKLNELREYQKGTDTMHPILLKPVRK